MRRWPSCLPVATAGLVTVSQPRVLLSQASPAAYEQLQASKAIGHIIPLLDICTCFDQDIW